MRIGCMTSQMGSRAQRRSVATRHRRGSGHGHHVLELGNQAVYQLTPSNNMVTVVEGVDASADIGFDARRSRVLIPLFNANEIWIRGVEVGGPGRLTDGANLSLEPRAYHI